MSKVFDRVWHEGIIYKKICKGENGDLLTLIES